MLPFNRWKQEICNDIASLYVSSRWLAEVLHEHVTNAKSPSLAGLSQPQKVIHFGQRDNLPGIRTVQSPNITPTHAVLMNLSIFEDGAKMLVPLKTRIKAGIFHRFLSVSSSLTPET